MIFDNFKRFKKRIALISQDNKKITYGDIIKFKESLKNQFKKRSLTILISDNSSESIMIYVSLVILKIPILLLNQTIRSNDLKLLIKKFNVQKIFLTNKSDFKNISEFKKTFIATKFRLLVKKNLKNIKINKKIMILLPTSGTMSESKLIKLSYENYLSNTKSIIKYLNLNKSDRTITTLPISYSYGLSIINTHLMRGASIVTGDFSLVEKTFWSSNSLYKPTNINGVPFFYDILSKIGFKKILTKKSKFFTVAGGKISFNTLKKISENLNFKKISFYLMYGQTEASPRMTYHKLVKRDLKKNKIPAGQAIDGCKIYLYNKKKQNISKNNLEGEIIFKGPNIFGGYAENSEDLKFFAKKKYLFTGDLGIFDKKKKLYITGRKSRIAKVYGFRLNLDQLESKLKNKAACIVKNDKLYIFSHKKLNVSNYIDLPNNSFKMIVLNKFPKTDSGKISYNKLLLKI